MTTVYMSVYLCSTILMYVLSLVLYMIFLYL